MKMLKPILFLFAFATTLSVAQTFTASGVVKVFKGPEGEKISMVEVEDGKKMVVAFKGLGGEVEGKSFVYQLNDLGYGKQELAWERKRGSKMLHLILAEKSDGRWMFYPPGKATSKIALTYSEKDSESAKAEEILRNVLQPK